jgi:precorrin-2 dehydrogenase/sirohydrochlorin ferrochelatase
VRYYPIFLELGGRPVAVVGGGKVAERKVRSLIRAQAAVRVISPKLTPGLERLAAKGKVTVTRRGYRKGDLERAALVFAATDNPATQRAVRRDAKAAGAFVNLADNPRESSFLVPALFSQGDLLVAISTSGASPALARRLRHQLQKTVGSEYRTYLRFMREARRQVMEQVPDPRQRARILRKLAAGVGADWARAARPSRARGEVRRILRKLGVKTKL